MWIAVYFECMNVPLRSTTGGEVLNANCRQSLRDDFMEKIFVNKPVALRFEKPKKSYYNNRKLEKIGYIKYFGEVCVEWFIGEMLM